MRWRGRMASARRRPAARAVRRLWPEAHRQAQQRAGWRWTAAVRRGVSKKRYVAARAAGMVQSRGRNFIAITAATMRRRCWRRSIVCHPNFSNGISGLLSFRWEFSIGGGDGGSRTD